MKQYHSKLSLSNDKSQYTMNELKNHVSDLQKEISLTSESYETKISNLQKDQKQSLVDMRNAMELEKHAALSDLENVSSDRTNELEMNILSKMEETPGMRKHI